MTNQKPNKALFQTGKDDWETPQKLFGELDREFHFTLDPCCSHENAKCRKHYTEVENGLVQNWGGRDRVLQSAIQQAGKAGRMGKEMLGRSTEARNSCCGPSTCKNRYRAVSRIHTREGGDSFYPRPLAV